MQKDKNRHIRQFIQSDIGFILPSLLGVLLFTLLPLLDVIGRSFVNAGHPGFINYRVVLSNSSFRLAFRNTLQFEMISLPLLFVISLLIAIAVKEIKHSFVTFAFLIPMAIPSNSVAVIWRILFDDHGIVNGWIVNVFHGDAVRFLQGNAAFWLLIATFLWKNVGYNMLLWLAGLSMLPPAITEAAKIDGAGKFVIFIRILLPNLKGTIFTVWMLSLMNSFKIFREVYLIAGNYPDDHIYLLQHLFNNWFSKLEIGKIAAAACVTAVLFFVILLSIRYMVMGRQEKSRIDGRGRKQGIWGKKGKEI